MNRGYIHFLVVLVILSSGCDQEFVEPFFENPFDPEDAQTHGDPFSLRAEADSSACILTWTPVDKPAPDEYVIYRKPDTVSAYTEVASLAHPADAYVDSVDGINLSVNQIYFYMIVAKLNNQFSDSSEVTAVNITLDHSVVLEDPALVSSGVQLTWVNNSMHNPGSYNVFRRNASLNDESFDLAGTVDYPGTTYTDEIDGVNLQVHYTYDYYISTVFGGVESSSMSEVKPVTVDFSIDMSAETVNAGVQLTWNINSTLSPGSFSIYRGNGEDEKIAEVNQPDSTFTDTIDGENLMVNNTYVYFVTANFNGVEADTSSAGSVSLNFELTGITANARREDEVLGVRVNWELNSIHTPDQYEIYRSQSETGSYQLAGEAETTSYFDSGIDENEMGNTFWYYIVGIYDNHATDEALAEKKQVVIEFTVPGSYSTIQQGIIGSIDMDTLTVKDGTYYENIDFQGKKLMLQSENGPGYCTINGSGNGSVITFESEEDTNTVLNGFTITNGYETKGGGIFFTDESSPKIVNCVITENQADSRGGGVYATDESNPIFRNCVFSNNVSDADGGAVYCNRTIPSFILCTFENNQAASNGGGMYIKRSDLIQIKQTMFDGNTADFGGGIYCDDSENTGITNCLFINNIGSNGGGAIFSEGASPQITHCTLHGNETDNWEGGGIYCKDGSTPVILNSILWNNIGSPDPEIHLHSEGDLITITYSDIDGGWEGDGNIDADPLFVNPGNGDFHLQEGSPCIDSGENGVDMGAYGGGLGEWE